VPRLWLDVTTLGALRAFPGVRQLYPYDMVHSLAAQLNLTLHVAEC